MLETLSHHWILIGGAVLGVLVGIFTIGLVSINRENEISSSIEKIKNSGKKRDTD